MTHVVVFNGGPLGDFDPSRLPAGDLVIAADSGLHAALVLGVQVDVAIGDFDSVSADQLARAVTQGTQVIQYPRAKDATDFEIAMDYAIDNLATEITIVGGSGGRLDHLLGITDLIAAPRYAAAAVQLLCGSAKVTVIRKATELGGRVGEIVSLLPATEVASNITTTGLLYQLKGEDLHRGNTRGVSNEFVETSASISLTEGVLLAVQPGPADA